MSTLKTTAWEAKFNSVEFNSRSHKQLNSTIVPRLKRIKFVW